MNAVCPLFERYRPTRWEDLVGQAKIVRRIGRLQERGGLAGRAYWISGQSGTGKTTVARLIAQEVADPLNVEEVDATGLSAAAIRSLEQESQLYGMGPLSGRCYLVNEAHGLNRAAVRQLLTTLERIPGHVVWAFTTTNDGQEGLFEELDDAHPLLSRCIELPLARRGLAEAFAERAREIAIREDLDGRPPAAYLELVRQKRNNLRAVLQEIEAGAMLVE
ncbi:AAA family ATPase [Aeoliella sp. ICT_H6.2]|uniref:AAA family ATPase n=1 Tax=Aeoliella straminimaris TaxID=2954799 RepID=A0A9X2JHD4_9BACT|nr:AAA family ATPase [Aeoliella straminimaris]MCO6045940.1 AAA family ATPase [Aeoliella straminimaris]